MELTTGPAALARGDGGDGADAGGASAGRQELWLQATEGFARLTKVGRLEVVAQGLSTTG
ncbi:hypothetical protein T261_01602 [Streptomyces lydicus]|nr:hypothetical protein T261_01602 [Streptomyces lydicus]